MTAHDDEYADLEKRYVELERRLDELGDENARLTDENDELREKLAMGIQAAKRLARELDR